jgi:Kef-type K+ transport system membrane component KefB
VSGGSDAGALRSPVIPALGLAVLLLFLFGATRGLPDGLHGVGPIAATGCLLLGGALMSELAERAGIPHLTGYLLAGILVGPYVLGFIGHEAAEALSPVNNLALALIALAGGAELDLESLSKGKKSLAVAMGLQSLLVMLLVGGAFIACKPLFPFAAALPERTLLAAALLWGVMAVTRSPSACLGILSETRASGPVATFSLNFIMCSDLVVVVLLAAAIAFARVLADPGATLSAAAIRDLGREILGSVAIGTTLGLLLALYLRLVGKQLLVVLLAVGFGLSETLRYARFDALLTFLVAGFVVRNLTKEGPTLLAEIEKLGATVFVLFFATAGAHLDLPLLGRMWPVALFLCALRGGATWIAAHLSSRIAADPPVLSRYGWTGLISQAGLALGLAGVVSRSFPAFGPGFRALSLATIALNELLGPILFKRALDKAGETRHGAR